MKILVFSTFSTLNTSLTCDVNVILVPITVLSYSTYTVQYVVHILGVHTRSIIYSTFLLKLSQSVLARHHEDTIFQLTPKNAPKWS
jgi:hypothetical protein